MAGRFLPYLMLLAEVLVFWRRVLFSPRNLIPWDLPGYHLPLATFIARSLGNGELPLWDPYTYCGFPFFANVQTQLFYPPAWPFFLLSNLVGHERLLDLLEWQIALHAFLGGVFTYWLLRRLGAARSAATLGATVFQLGAFFASQAQHLGAVCGGAWLPLGWLAIVALAGSFTWRWTAALAISLAMAFLAGFPAVTSVVFVSCFLLALVLTALRRASWKLPGIVAIACVWAGLLAAIQLLPTMELVRLSAAASRGLFVGAGGGVPLQSLVSMVIPNYYSVFDLSRYTLRWNPTFLYLYCGIAGLLLAAAVVVFRRGPHWLLYALVTLGSGFWMLGETTPPWRAVFPHLPVAVKSPLYSEFAMLSFVLGLAVLAGLGAHEFVARRSSAVAAALVVIAATDLILVSSGRVLNTAPVTRDSIVTTQQFEGTAATSEGIRRLVNEVSPPWRVEAVDDSMNWASSASVVGAPTANGNEPLALTRILKVRLLFCEGWPWDRYYVPSKLDSPLVDLLNIRYVVSWPPTDPPAVAKAGLPRIEELPGHRVYRNPDALPRFFLIGRVRNVRGIDEALSVMESPGFRPAAEAVAERWSSVGRDVRGAMPPVSVIEYTNHRVVMESEAPAPAFLVSSDTFYPGWRAFIDGREEPLVLTNAAFRGLPVPAGRHRIEMRFEPAILGYGAAASVAGWLLVLAAAVFGDNKRKRASWISLST